MSNIRFSWKMYEKIIMLTPEKVWYSWNKGHRFTIFLHSVEKHSFYIVQKYYVDWLKIDQVLPDYFWGRFFSTTKNVKILELLLHKYFWLLWNQQIVAMVTKKSYKGLLSDTLYRNQLSYLVLNLLRIRVVTRLMGHPVN